MAYTLDENGVHELAHLLTLFHSSLIQRGMSSFEALQLTQGYLGLLFAQGTGAVGFPFGGINVTGTAGLGGRHPDPGSESEPRN